MKNKQLIIFLIKAVIGTIVATYATWKILNFILPI